MHLQNKLSISKLAAGRRRRYLFIPRNHLKYVLCAAMNHQVDSSHLALTLRKSVGRSSANSYLINGKRTRDPLAKGAKHISTLLIIFLFFELLFLLKNPTACSKFLGRFFLDTNTAAILHFAITFAYLRLLLIVQRGRHPSLC